MADQELLLQKLHRWQRRLLWTRAGGLACCSQERAGEHDCAPESLGGGSEGASTLLPYDILVTRVIKERVDDVPRA